MDVIQGSHVERIQKYLDENPRLELRATKTGSVKELPWRVRIVNQLDYVKYEVHSATMGDALQQLSRWIYEQDPTVQDIHTVTDRLTQKGRGNIEEI